MPELSYIMLSSNSLRIGNTRKVTEEKQIQRTSEAQRHLEIEAVNSRLLNKVKRIMHLLKKEAGGKGRY